MQQEETKRGEKKEKGEDIKPPNGSNPPKAPPIPTGHARDVGRLHRVEHLPQRGLVLVPRADVRRHRLAHVLAAQAGNRQKLNVLQHRRSRGVDRGKGGGVNKREVQEMNGRHLSKMVVKSRES